MIAFLSYFSDEYWLYKNRPPVCGILFSLGIIVCEFCVKDDIGFQHEHLKQGDSVFGLTIAEIE